MNAEKERAQRVLKKTKETRKKIKGRMVEIPGYLPKTAIFVRKGRDVNVAIRSFLRSKSRN